jgi:hypothetical protein
MLWANMRPAPVIIAPPAAPTAPMPPIPKTGPSNPKAVAVTAATPAPMIALGSTPMQLLAQLAYLAVPL